MGATILFNNLGNEPAQSDALYRIIQSDIAVNLHRIELNKRINNNLEEMAK
jgi:hypothetical protein